jgi:hypothetical protein
MQFLHTNTRVSAQALTPLTDIHIHRQTQAQTHTQACTHGHTHIYIVDICIKHILEVFKEQSQFDQCKKFSSQV